MHNWNKTEFGAGEEASYLLVSGKMLNTIPIGAMFYDYKFSENL